MKIFFSTFFLLYTSHLFAQYLPDTIASRLKISKVIRHMNDHNNQIDFTDYYNKSGNIVKMETYDKYAEERTITTFTYENGMKIKEIFKSYYKRKLVASQMIIFRYNANKKYISTIVHFDDKQILKDTTIYSDYTDTTYSYSNDTMIYDSKRKLKLVAQANSFHSEKITINLYNETGFKLRQIVFSARDREGCSNINRFSMTDSTGYSIIDFFKTKDTLIEKVTRWLCVKGKEIKFSKSVRISPNETYKEEWGGTTRVYDKLNEVNLVDTRKIINKIGDGIISETTIIYQYYFYKR